LLSITAMHSSQDESASFEVLETKEEKERERERGTKWTNAGQTFSQIKAACTFSKGTAGSTK